MKNLTPEQLTKLYLEYVSYRDSLQRGEIQMSVSEYFTAVFNV